MEFFPIKKPLSFFNHTEYDIESNNIKILDKNVVPPGSAP